jgi:hypothetical protein
VTATTRAELAGDVERHEDGLDELRSAIAATRERCADHRGAGLVALELERALVSIAGASRALQRAQHEADR